MKNALPKIKFVFPNYAGYQDQFCKTFDIPIDVLKSFANVQVELKKNFENRDGLQTIYESKLKLLATSSVPVEEIDLSKFDQPKSESFDIPA